MKVHQLNSYREISTQLRSIRRLILQLQDDCGDLSVSRDEPLAEKGGELSDWLSEVECRMQREQECFAKAALGE